MIDIKMMCWGLEELASLEEQNRLWIGNSTEEMSTYEEAVCHVFDDSGLGAELDSLEKRKRYQAEFLNLTNELRSVTRGSTLRNLPPTELIETKEMEVIRSLSKKLLDYVGTGNICDC